MTRDYATVRDAAVDWHIARFPNAQAPMVTLKACEEMGEVASAILGAYGPLSATGAGNVPEEAADVVIALMVLLGRWYQGFDLLDEVAKKIDKLTDPNSTHRASVSAGREGGMADG